MHPIKHYQIGLKAWVDFFDYFLWKKNSCNSLFDLINNRYNFLSKYHHLSNNELLKNNLSSFSPPYKVGHMFRENTLKQNSMISILKHSNNTLPQLIHFRNSSSNQWYPYRAVLNGWIIMNLLYPFQTSSSQINHKFVCFQWFCCVLSGYLCNFFFAMNHSLLCSKISAYLSYANLISKR